MTKQTGLPEQTVTRLHTEKETCEMVSRIQNFINKYVSFTDNYSLPIALWVLCTYVFQSFDAFPYMLVTAATKRSGKSRLGIDLMSFVASNPRSFGSMTAASMFRLIEAEHPTILFDEAEELSGESASAMRSVLNVGYRRGSKVPRVVGNSVKEFDTYCPKVFILIGDTYDTLRDRAIIIRMQRADAPNRFVYEVAKQEGNEIREDADLMVNDMLPLIAQGYLDFKGIDFLTDRDEEIWSPLFVMAQAFCPERIAELSRIAIDMAMEKTADKVRYVDTSKMEEQAEEKEYSVRLLRDLELVMAGKNISSSDAVVRLREIAIAPWRKFRGDGITMNNIADMLARFPNVRPVPIRTAGGRKNSKVFKGYRIDAVREAIKKLESK